MRSLLLVIVAIGTTSAIAGDPVALETAISRGLDFVAKDSIAWRTEHSCAACHHAALAVWAFRDAKARGIAVDDTLLQELNQQMSDAGDGRFNGERPAEKPKALNAKALYFSLALSQNPDPAAAAHDGTKLLLSTVKSDQTEDGSWMAWHELRHPFFFSSDECATILGVLAVLTAADAGDAEAAAARDKGVAWLTTHTADNHDLQTLALRIALWNRLGRPHEESQSWVDLLRSRQSADGGWSQTSEMASDAWATGQALYALGLSGAGPDDESVSRGQQFLISTQRDDGGWPMTSRPMKPGGQGSGSLIPIIGGGSAWGVLGLIASSERPG
ncbi:MAG: hypothetical protein JNG89_00860 [Planctomycetaceae bacterium]|nr:hypothetical protein [Planctomycetaceae bacterium]